MAGRFALGRVVATPGALAVLQQAKQRPIEFLARHIRGDWGEIEQEDWKANDDSVSRHLRILSVYFTNNHNIIWVITEADRSSTSILLPEEY